MFTENQPEIVLGVVGVSRDCFPKELTKRRLAALMAELKKKKINAVAADTIVENEADALAALNEFDEKGVNAAVIYLGNFGPEGPTTIFAESFAGPVMVVAAAEESKKDLIGGRGDALCGLLNNSYNLNLRKVQAYIPQYPVGLPADLAPAIAKFIALARVIVGVSNVKIFGFGPRPHDFLACNAPIGPLFDLGVEVMENSELDLLVEYRRAKENKAAVEAVVKDMEKELGKKNPYPDLLPRIAALEVALEEFYAQHLGASSFGIFANKCWPAFQTEFGFVPCYVNSRLTAKGIPVACEVDLYGALSEFMAQCASDAPVTLMDINNSVPFDQTPKTAAALKGAKPEDLFMGFHCGNTCTSCLKNCKLGYQLIMNRLLEGGKKPDITRGTMEGQLKPGPCTLFRLQSSPDAKLQSYVADGHILDIDPQSFGSIGIFAIPHFARFYRHVMVGKHYPHHGAVAFAQVGEILYEACKYLGIPDIGTPLPDTLPYAGENPFALFK
ncbi:MAG: fucose isomerase [Planctomycetota bacterium]|jgi:L-fucose isomerase-like protein|nr:fucose isomerase [Planctomycetota bacterium]